ncbi:hypothetical protein LC653_27885 [Nostoc sp. CHAB 5784]|uniref:hypothetical protein n=1 Tax=Nostoc mirabile TaxID=2907820 RepID=UPI001E4E96D1|nr:hypothetical protein [Nostoc mirabile]MCC5667600.1 hypothetical protein [Nostoc mirabile CHAB5784]
MVSRLVPLLLKLASKSVFEQEKQLASERRFLPIVQRKASGIALVRASPRASACGNAKGELKFST